jgi:hypothetical protein
MRPVHLFEGRDHAKLGVVDFDAVLGEGEPHQLVELLPFQHGPRISAGVGRCLLFHLEDETRSLIECSILRWAQNP